MAKAGRGSQGHGSREGEAGRAAQESLAAAKAEIAAAKAELEELRRQAETVQSVGSEPQGAQASLTLAKAEIAAAQAELKDLRLRSEALRRVQAEEAPFLPGETETPFLSASEETVPASSNASEEHGRVRGLPWASNLGWLVAGAGLVLVSYSYVWAMDHFPSDFEPAGMSGVYVGAVLSFLGLTAGAVFLFVPGTHEVASDRSASWTELERRVRAQLALDRRLAHVGVASWVVGFLLLALLARQQLATWPDGDLGPLSYEGVEALLAAVAVLGALLWVFAHVHARGKRETLAVLRVGERPAPASQASSAARGPSSLGVSDEDVKALMRKVDSMLATLPDEVVSSFSKTSEADTYLKILGHDAKKD